MKTLRVCNIGGLFHEMFDPSPDLDINLAIQNGFLDASSFFWAKHLEKGAVQQLVQIMKLNITRTPYQTPQYLSVSADAASFIERIQRIPEVLTDPQITPQAFFAQLETLEILCKLYSDFIYFPNSLHIQNGFDLDETSSSDIYNHCLNPRKNPCFSFTADNVMPLIYEYDPDVIFLQGKVSYYLMTIALLTKQRNPHVHICVTRHASEYYSLNKIADLLIDNNALFQMVDSVILEYFDEIEPKLIYALNNKGDLQSVPNLIYKNLGGKIVQTKFMPPEKESALEIFYRKTCEVSGKNSCAVDIHFEPYTKCPWSRCTFCGINKKYRHETIPLTYETFVNKIHLIQKLAQEYQYIWFIDEAISSDKLQMLAEHFISEQIDIIWQARCRADKTLLENGLPSLLEKSGLRELRIGLESASYFVLNQMNKFDEGFSLELMEEIINTYQSHNISIHCPMILGFPQEDASERQKTYEFLSQACAAAPLFTFNLNILNLDVSSKLYRDWAKFQLESISYTCPPKYFLGNCVAWIPTEEQRILDHECQAFMREHLYPWMPANSMVQPTILYRLSETSRYTLRWKADGSWIKSHQDRPFSAEMELQISDDLSIVPMSSGMYLVYSWTSHHYMQGDQLMMGILNRFRNPCKISDAINSLSAENPDVYYPDELMLFLQKFYAFHFLKGEYQFRNILTDNELKAAYDQIYQEETFIYTVEEDRCLRDWSRFLTPGAALELGVGFGKNVRFLCEKGFQVTGVDFSEVAVRKMRERHPDCKFFAADIRDFPITQGKYSLIVCSLVLSYLSKEDLVILAQKIVDGLSAGGYLYFVDLSHRDPLAAVPPSQTSDHRNFFTIEEVISLFASLDIVELSDVFRKEPRRIGCHGAFGLINFLGKKPEN